VRGETRDVASDTSAPHPQPLSPQGRGEHSNDGDAFFLLTDADIKHAPGSLRRLVSESINANLGSNSRMARLRCVSDAEKLLIPAFVYFFNLLYPMRRVNNPADPLAAGAGGCVLLSKEAIDKLGGGFESIRGEIIDDVNLARQVKGRGLPIRLSLSRTEVLSLRDYPLLADIWKMVRRTAFTELKYSWLRLAGAMAGLTLLFVVPFLALLVALLLFVLSGSELPLLVLATGLLAKSTLALILMRTVYTPAIKFFELPPHYSLMLAPAAVLYALMTVDSALRHARGSASEWRVAPAVEPSAKS